jgi:hypothetical protein
LEPPGHFTAECAKGAEKTSLDFFGSQFSAASARSAVDRLPIVQDHLVQDHLV